MYRIVDVLGAGVGPALYALYVPGMLFELGLALWLLVKGFAPSPASGQDVAPAAGDATE